MQLFNRPLQTIIITGGAGFIGSALVRFLIKETSINVVNLDKLTYAGNIDSLQECLDNPRHNFHQLDICDRESLEQIFIRYQPDAVMHLAAESHVDRSINDPGNFVQTNIVGTFNLLQVANLYYQQLSATKKSIFCFHHISTDEVFGSLRQTGHFNEQSSYQPNSPYSATKASSDHLARAWHVTYGLPVIISNCSNNYGPYHFPEKLIPHMILNAIHGRGLPIYGQGLQIRDWLYVEDHIDALYKIVTNGLIGETYLIGGNNEQTNLTVVHKICNILEEYRSLIPNLKHDKAFSDLIKHVTDRPGHDARYAIDARKIMQTLGWVPRESFESGLRKTVLWYLENEDWWQRVLNGNYRLQRLGELA